MTDEEFEELKKKIREAQDHLNHLQWLYRKETGTNLIT